ncbi:hypothetical protein [Bacillus thuringiensis]|uniref:Transposase n=1 Tax=Bacillus thuringiensis serovar toumanoffi TaxID=180862 RepID=A0ABD5IA37_BACTU|nr:hypothetical protein [Bacillus thuringiensis]MCR6784329.1 hypothetical protein [Bacillus thuringiensis]MCR6863137.1 hypothetical protein [Bacillus thuringiensis]MCR6869254.1 hypothetical protein [Bacillus thuringiensis]MDW9213996.1 hypothetical protein [Bacillus thuringiensis serovar toumanoffi]MED2578591.1 hypothetical protein [Bacillus thuringiensis]
MEKTKYEKPHCQCGADLRFIGDLSVIASINSKGSPSRVGLFIGKDHRVFRLWCPLCNCEYKGSVDETGRVIKGNKLMPENNCKVI